MAQSAASIRKVVSEILVSFFAVCITMTSAVGIAQERDDTAQYIESVAAATRACGAFYSQTEVIGTGGGSEDQDGSVSGELSVIQGALEAALDFESRDEQLSAFHQRAAEAFTLPLNVSYAEYQQCLDRTLNTILDQLSGPDLRSRIDAFGDELRQLAACDDSSAECIHTRRVYQSFEARVSAIEELVCEAAHLARDIEVQFRRAIRPGVVESHRDEAFREVERGGGAAFRMLFQALAVSNEVASYQIPMDGSNGELFLDISNEVNGVIAHAQINLMSVSPQSFSLSRYRNGMITGDVFAEQLRLFRRQVANLASRIEC